MTPEAWLTILGSGLLAAVIPAAIGAWQQRQSRQAAQPLEGERAKTEESVRLSAENKRLADRNAAQEKRLDEQDVKIDALIAEVRQLRGQLATAQRRITELEHPTEPTAQ
jgi:predicted RNase H-like nuclease (RuvC/YqgF family)